MRAVRLTLFEPLLRNNLQVPYFVRIFSHNFQCEAAPIIREVMLA